MGFAKIFLNKNMTNMGKEEKGRKEGMEAGREGRKEAEYFF